MGKISLKGLKFKAYHGYYDREREQGNIFLVDIILKTDFQQAAIEDELRHTVDYEDLYSIVEEEMAKSSKLLEYVVESIATRVINEMQELKWVKVKLSKLNPPIKGECQRAVVSLKKYRE
ncbi:MAG: dihydroneopterin aldolase [Bacteroidota bacterium]